MSEGQPVRVRSGGSFGGSHFKEREASREPPTSGRPRRRWWSPTTWFGGGEAGLSRGGEQEEDPYEWFGW